MKKILRVKRRINGVGGDPRYMEYYLHNGLKNYGYTLTREVDKASFKVTAYNNFRIDTVYYESTFFDEIAEEEVCEFNRVLTESMKEPAELADHPGCIDTKGVAVYEFYFSDKSDAFSVEPLIKEGGSVLELGLRECLCSVGNPWVTKIVNFGGPSKGVEIIIETNLVTSLCVKFEKAQLRRYTKDGLSERSIQFDKKGNRYICRVDDFEIAPGLNKLSAQWCRSRRMQDGAEFYISFVPEGNVKMPINGRITVTPYDGKGISLMLEKPAKE